LNTTDLNQLKEAQAILIEQKPLVYSYLVDEAQDEMVGENAAMAMVYSGEAAAGIDFNENLDYSVPKEGSNMWIDSWFIPRTCRNQENAEKFLDFLCREDIAMKNFEYVYYATPNQAVFNALPETLQNDTVIFPPSEVLDNCEIFQALPEDVISTYNELWREVKSN
jgi:spermidine/putrescine transport system substrate-binding protein/spermidine/putrescine transport system permease protein